ncbi:MAG TPA: hypothetical protein VK424_08595 [Thermoplasmata archaeon]|nr:hypothetical protein [Thermoplasmata archaeon]
MSPGRRTRSPNGTSFANGREGCSTTGKSSGSPSESDRPHPSGRPRVLVDTNALFLVIRSRFPLDEEVGRHRPGAVLAVPSSVLGELDRLARSLTPGAVAARALADRYERIETRVRGDGGVLDVAQRRGAWVVTADRAFQRRLVAHHITVLRPRDQHRLEVVEGRPAPRVRPTPQPRPRRPRGNS